ncbi:helix-turn-helix domain-containing protein [Paraburkholderia silvatlantica]|uniref:helix-turn-helix domain-containing protein n=1 Tax=Paraburkholderia silvatlantica TaxID=321895 RepID=UPI0037524452
MEQLTPEIFKASSDPRRAKKIGIVVSDGFALLSVGAVVEILHLANAIHASGSRGDAPYDVRLVSASGGVVESASSIGVQTTRAEFICPPAELHAVFVATGHCVDGATESEHASSALRRFISFASMVFTITDGQTEVDTSDPECLRAHAVRMKGETRIEPVGQATSLVELVLGLVESDLGGAITQDIRRRVSHPVRWHFCSLAPKRSVTALSQQIQRAVRWLETNATHTITTDDAARFASMSSRNFQRRFKAETGITPSEYLLQFRIKLCCKMLAESRLPVDKIARRCGLRGGAQLSKLLRRRLNTTPTDYRAQVQGSLRA